MGIRCKKMTFRECGSAYSLLYKFLHDDEYYQASRAVYGDKGASGLLRALKMILRHGELGFVWLAFEANKPVGVCVVCYAISTSIGGRVAKLDDVFVANEMRRRGVGTRMIADLIRQLRREKVYRIDSAVHKRNRPAAKYYQSLGFRPLDEIRVSLVLK
jgi:GNAT superfamily N-acetyltransferase